MQQLSGLDASFLHGELERTPMHIDLILVYDPSTARGGAVRFKDVLATFDERCIVTRAGSRSRSRLAPTCCPIRPSTRTASARPASRCSAQPLPDPRRHHDAGALRNRRRAVRRNRGSDARRGDKAARGAVPG